MKEERRDNKKAKIFEEMEAKFMKETNKQRNEGKKEVNNFPLIFEEEHINNNSNRLLLNITLLSNHVYAIISTQELGNKNRVCGRESFLRC
jgi:hypothetical protein